VRLVVDLGAGDGHGARAIALRDPDALVIAIDAVAGGLAETSRRAGAAAGRGGIANLRCVRASAERPPVEIVGRADRVVVDFPWGSLARGVLGLDQDALRGLASLLRPGGHVDALVSIVERDRAAIGAGPERLADPATVARAWQAHGLALRELRPATAAEIAASGSRWSRRLRTDRSRTVTRLAGVRDRG
jgi:16S rRNA (adenine(1408)-N(1))-methyltransferase